LFYNRAGTHQCFMAGTAVFMASVTRLAFILYLLRN